MKEKRKKEDKLSEFSAHTHINTSGYKISSALTESNFQMQLLDAIYDQRK